MKNDMAGREKGRTWESAVPGGRKIGTISEGEASEGE